MHAAKGLCALCGECRGSTAAGVATAANSAAAVVVKEGFILQAAIRRDFCGFSAFKGENDNI